MNKHDVELMFHAAQSLLFHLSWHWAERGSGTFDVEMGAYHDTQIGELVEIIIAQETKFSIKDFFSKCDQIQSFRRIWSHLL